MRFKVAIKQDKIIVDMMMQGSYIECIETHNTGDDMKIQTIIDDEAGMKYTFDRVLNDRDAIHALSRIAQIIAFDNANNRDVDTRTYAMMLSIVIDDMRNL